MSKIIAIYMRLSVADDEVLQDESNSIKAQRDLMYQFINEKEEFKDYEIEEFCDDGYSGTNFDRPGVQRMLELAESGIVNVIIYKLAGRQIRLLRNQHDITQKDFAEKINSSQNYLSDVETCKKRPSLDYYITIANFFTVSAFFDSIMIVRES